MTFSNPLQALSHVDRMQGVVPPRIPESRCRRRSGRKAPSRTSVLSERGASRAVKGNGKLIGTFTEAVVADHYTGTFTSPGWQEGLGSTP